MDKKLMTLAAVISGMLTLASCGEVSNTSTGAGQTTTQAVTTDQENKETETTTKLITEKETTQAKTDEASDDDSSEAQSEKAANAQTAEADDSKSAEADYNSIADKLLMNINEIDKFAASVVKCDESDVHTQGSYSYYHVTDSRFSSTSDVKAYIDQTMTDKLYKARYASVVGDDNAYFIDVDGKLYIKQSPKGAGFEYKEEPARIYDTTDTSFTIDKEYDDYGAVSYLRLNVVKTDAGWRIDTLEYGVPIG